MAGSMGSGPYNEGFGEHEELQFLKNTDEQIPQRGMDILVNLLRGVGFSVATILFAIGYVNHAEIAELTNIDPQQLKDLLLFAPWVPGVLAALFFLNAIRYAQPGTDSHNA